MVGGQGPIQLVAAGCCAVGLGWVAGEGEIVCCEGGEPERVGEWGRWNGVTGLLLEWKAGTDMHLCAGHAMSCPK